MLPFSKRCPLSQRPASLLPPVRSPSEIIKRPCRLLRFFRSREMLFSPNIEFAAGRRPRAPLLRSGSFSKPSPNGVTAFLTLAGLSYERRHRGGSGSLSVTAQCLTQSQASTRLCWDRVLRVTLFLP